MLFEDKVDEKGALFHIAYDLFLYGDNITSKMCASLLVTSCPYTNINERIETCINVLPLKQLRKVSGHWKASECVGVRSGRINFKELYMRKTPFNKVYNCWLKPQNLATSMKCFQEHCPIIPQMTRTTKIDGHAFQNMPVYCKRW